MESTLADLYNGLTLLSYIQHAKTDLRSSPETADMIVGPIRSPWQELLDSICVLCDFNQAADAFVALGVEQKLDGSRFWIAFNGTNTEDSNDAQKRMRAGDFLRKILKLSREATQKGAHRRAEIVEEITNASIRQSRKKVHNYRSRLKTSLKQATLEHQTRPVVSEGQ